MSVNVLFVCLGNICRSPTAHGVFEMLVQRAGLSDAITTDSAGTAAWHTGKSPDPRSAAAAAARGYDLTHLRARQVQPSDFDEFDYVLAMDSQNFAELKAIQPEGYKGCLALFLNFADADESEVPDPYYGGTQGFEQVLDLVEDAAQGLLEDIRVRHGVGSQ
ncbi:MAG: low molecular weight protein-tyrosine-phosphatase [Candidatus Pelagadaptatus aseana]